jgi:hypothetical protein
VLAATEGTTSAVVAVTKLLTSAQANDSSGAFSGVAIVAGTGPGIWQYKLNGTTWLAVGIVSENVGPTSDEHREAAIRLGG